MDRSGDKLQYIFIVELSIKDFNKVIQLQLFRLERKCGREVASVLR